MLTRPVCAAALLLAACGGLLLALRPGPRADEPPARPAPAARVLPGIRTGGEVLLPNGWSLRPAGRQVPLGDFPVNMALHPGGRWLAVLHAGYGPHEVIVLDLERATPGVVSRVVLEQTFYGL